MQDFVSAFFEPVTLLIILSIIIVAFWKRDKNLVTLFGIFGTFLGIVIGLHEIDSENIANSIPNLLSGLYTAFYTSIAGLLASIILTLIEKDSESKDSDDYLQDISEKLSILITGQESLNKNIGGEGETSLLTQVQKLRTTFSDKQDELKNSFDEFSKSMAENNMKALIEAIQKVMEDFNTKINDQLGQSFKDLTTAIDNLLKWQEEYKQNIISSTESLNASKESLERSSKGFEITVEQSEKFSGISESLGSELRTLNESLEILKAGLKEFDGIADNSKEASKILIESLEALKNNFVSKAEVMISESENHIRNMKESFEKQSGELKNAHKNILESLKQELENNNKISSEQFLKMQGKLENQVLEFDKKLGEELEKSLKTLGEQLTGLSGKFVSDYGNLAEKLEKLITLSK